jgi:hypothetical protein
MILVFLRFAVAYWRAKLATWQGYEAIAPVDVQTWRTRRCEMCDFFQDGACQKCGCSVFAKTMMATEKCPVGRWNRVWIRKQN